MDYIPIVSTVTNLTALFLQKVVIPRIEPQNRLFSHFKNKDYTRCVTLLIPVIGNLIILVDDLNKLKKYLTALETWRADPAVTGKKEEAVRRLRYAGMFDATRLNLFNLGLNSLPPVIWGLTSLTALNLGKNELTSLPPEMGQLTDLSELLLYDNALASLPGEIGRLKGLTRLVASGNKLTSLPEELWDLTSLKELYFFKNLLTTLPQEVGRLAGLTALDLSENQLSSIPEALGSLRHLQELGLQGNRLLCELPACLGQISGLRRLDSEDESQGAILKQCREKRDAETAAALPARLDGLKGVEALSERQKIEVSEWLDRLENRKVFEKQVNAILADVFTNKPFQEFFFAHMTLDLIEIYAVWKIMCAPESLNSSEKLKIMTGAAKTLRLRKELAVLIKEHKEYDPGEIYFHYEIRLKEQLKLEGMTNLRYKWRGARHWIDEKILVQRVNERFNQELDAMMKRFYDYF